MAVGKKMERALNNDKKKKKLRRQKKIKDSSLHNCLISAETGAKVQETEEQPFPDCKWEAMEDGEGTKKNEGKEERRSGPE